jgi:hypothetical protein
VSGFMIYPSVSSLGQWSHIAITSFGKPEPDEIFNIGARLGGSIGSFNLYILFGGVAADVPQATNQLEQSEESNPKTATHRASQERIPGGVSQECDRTKAFPREQSLERNP